MAEYIEREAVIKILNDEKLAYFNCGHIEKARGIAKVKDFLEYLPTADVVPKSEVIRCKDCINCDHCYPAKAIGEEAIEGWYCISHKRYVKPEDFCSFAELKKKYTEEEK